MFSYLDHTFVVTIHAVNALTSLGEDKFINAIGTNFALEAMRMV